MIISILAVHCSLQGSTENPSARQVRKAIKLWTGFNHYFAIAFALKEFKLRITAFFDEVLPEIASNLQSRINGNVHTP